VAEPTGRNQVVGDWELDNKNHLVFLPPVVFICEIQFVSEEEWVAIIRHRLSMGAKNHSFLLGLVHANQYGIGWCYYRSRSLSTHS
jgi:hypothetical protein